MNNQITKHLRISGHVQGVYYRAWSVSTATDLNLTGWVRNRKDTSVETLVTGPKDNVEHFIKACHTGPEFAKVNNIQINNGTNEDLKTFEFRETE